jgi:hypothetical protein
MSAAVRNAQLFSFSFIRTLTVGPGITPDLLTLPMEGARGLQAFALYRRWGITPRPENVLVGQRLFN